MHYLNRHSGPACWPCRRLSAAEALVRLSTIFASRVTRIVRSMCARPGLRERPPAQQAFRDRRCVVGGDEAAHRSGRGVRPESGPGRCADQRVNQVRCSPGGWYARTDIMRSGTGVSIRRGAVPSRISLPRRRSGAPCWTQKSITYLAEGASTAHVVRAFEKLGIAAALKPKTTLVPTDTVAERVAAGEAELGIGIIANILSVPGVELVGPFPPSLQFNIVFRRRRGRQESPNAREARDIIGFADQPQGRRHHRFEGHAARLARRRSKQPCTALQPRDFSPNSPALPRCAASPSPASPSPTLPTRFASWCPTPPAAWYVMAMMSSAVELIHHRCLVFCREQAGGRRGARHRRRGQGAPGRLYAQG